VIKVSTSSRDDLGSRERLQELQAVHPRRRRRESVVVLVFVGVVPGLVGIIFVLVGVVSVSVDGVPVLLPPAASCSPHAHRPY